MIENFLPLISLQLCKIWSFLFNWLVITLMVEIIGPYFEILILELIDMTIEKKEERGLGGSNFLSAQFRRIKSQLKMLS